MIITTLSMGKDALEQKASHSVFGYLTKLMLDSYASFGRTFFWPMFIRFELFQARSNRFLRSLQRSWKSGRMSRFARALWADCLSS